MVKILGWVDKEKIAVGSSFKELASHIAKNGVGLAGLYRIDEETNARNFVADRDVFDRDRAGAMD